MNTPGTVVIAGAGLAGTRCAETLRAEGYEGEVVLVGEEPHAPYERPALSKEFLAGNLCRCGSYLKILEAVDDAAARMAVRQ